MSVESDVAAVRAALLPAIARHAARRSRRRWIAPLAVLALLLAGSTAAATGVIWSEPKVDNSVPTVPEWQYWTTNPFAGGGPVLMRAHPAAVERVNRADEQALAAKGVTGRCGGDPGHPLACFTPSGELVPIVASTDTLGPADYDVKPLTDAEAHAWLCAHPTQRPGADGGEKPAPTKGYEDC